tara:strand:+ start:603 stop:746 length:144 start_codon:yes stop_codon:yes gene_type:complete
MPEKKEKNTIDWEHVFEPFLNNIYWDENDMLIPDDNVFLDDTNFEEE